MNFKYLASLLLALLLLVVSCGTGDKSRRDHSTTGDTGWIFEGWGGPPEVRSDGKTPAHTSPKDWYYMKFSARASEKAIAKKSQAMMQSTCREAARLQGASDVIKKMIGETLESASGVSDGQSTGSAIISQSKGLVKGVSAYDCKAIGPKTVKKKFDDWVECQCVISAKFEGGRDSLITKAKAIESAE